MRLLSVILALVIGTSAAAQEWVSSRGQLDDETFYRQVACAAPAGGNCSKPLIRWTERSARDLTVSIRGVDAGYPSRHAREISAALDAAIAEINAANSGIRLRRVADGRDAKVGLFLANVRANTMLEGAGRTQVLGAATVQVWSNRRSELTNAAIIFSNNLPRRDIQSVVLEELVQSLGLMTDLRNPFYNNRSIFAEDSNATRRLSGQDLMALRRHYPS